MAGFDDLLTSALPYLATETIQATAGTTWDWGYICFDSADDVVDLSSGFTVTARIRSTDGVVLVVPDVSFRDSGEFHCLVTPPMSADINEGVYNHEVTVTRDSDAAQLIVVGATHSKFVVLQKVDA